MAITAWATRSGPSWPGLLDRGVSEVRRKEATRYAPMITSRGTDALPKAVDHVALFGFSVAIRRSPKGYNPLYLLPSSFRRKRFFGL